MTRVSEYSPGSRGQYGCVTSLDCDCRSFFLFGPTPFPGVGPFFLLIGIAFFSSASPAQTNAKYVGSAACKACHADTYARWKNTRMTNVVREPGEHPEAVVPELSVADPLVTFTASDIALVYGSRW